MLGTINIDLCYILLLGNDLEAFLDVDGQVDDDFVGGAAYFVVLEENVRSELRDSLVDHIISVEVGFRGRTYNK